MKFAHDRVILFLLLLNGLLAAGGSLLILLRLDTSKGTGYIVEYRDNFGAGDYKFGGAINLILFIVYILLTLAMSFLISRRIYPIRRHFAIGILALNLLLCLLAIIVSNALIVV